MIPYKPPALGDSAFNCPHCNAYAKQTWHTNRFFPLGAGRNLDIEELHLATCENCSKYSLWLADDMMYPEGSGLPPNDDLRDDIKLDFLEARSILNKSPRRAAALLRLCVQKICQQLGEAGRDPNIDIGNLVKRGLPTRIQQSLDIVRVIGNNAVHPGQIDLKDDSETASKLFDLINLIAEVMITQPKQVEKLYDSLPSSSREQIDKRDNSTKKTAAKPS